MLQRLKIHLLRRFFNLVVASKWRKHLERRVRVEDHAVPVDGGRIGVRVFSPLQGGPFPVMLFFHGGGWMGGDLQSYDPMCRELCFATGHLLVSVDYRLAPEHRFPVAPQDCIAALHWTLAQAERLGGLGDGVVLCGDSAGGNLAAVVAIHARDRLPGRVGGQVLIYPVTDHYSAGTDSYREFARDRALSSRTMSRLWDEYLKDSPALPPGTTSHPLATPLRVDDLGGLPPALVLVAECDPLRDEGIAYARKLERCGVRVRCKVYPRQQHGFVGVAGPTEGHREAIGDIRRWLSAPP